MKTRLYWVWADMIGRCTNQNHKAFANYGGRGIAVCNLWRVYKNFAADMGERPDGALLDREDNNGDYEPGNCKWSTRKEQNSNRRNCIYVDCDGERVTLKEYCRRKDLKYHPIHKRIHYYGWSMDDALSIPVGSRRAA